MKKIILILISFFLSCDKQEIKSDGKMEPEIEIINVGDFYDDDDSDAGRDTCVKINNNFATLNKLGTNAEDITLKTRIINIGAWNMKDNASKTIDIDLSDIEVYLIDAIILIDGASYRYPIGFKGDGFILCWDAGIRLERETSGTFDSEDFDDAVMNRGFIIIQYYNSGTALKSWEYGYVGS